MKKRFLYYALKSRFISKTADLAALSLRRQAERLQVTHVSNGRWGSATKCAIPTGCSLAPLIGNAAPLYTRHHPIAAHRPVPDPPHHILARAKWWLQMIKWLRAAIKKCMFRIIANIYFLFFYALFDFLQGFLTKPALFISLIYSLLHANGKF